MRRIKSKLNIIVLVILTMCLLISSCSGEKREVGYFVLHYRDINYKHNNNKTYTIQVYDYLDTDKSKNGILNAEDHSVILYDEIDFLGIGPLNNEDGSPAGPDTHLIGKLTVTCTAESDNGRCNANNVRFELSKSKDGKIVDSVKEFGKSTKDVLRKGDVCDIEYNIDVPEDWVDDSETDWRLDIYFD